ncbi:MAG: AI-2E family transporter [Trueperaceae bacterium]
MLDAVKQVWRNPYVRVAVGLLIIYLLYSFLYWSKAVWGSVMGAYLIAFILHPLVAWAERRANRTSGVLLVAFLLLGLLAGLWFLGIQVAAQLSLFAEELPQLAEVLEELPFITARAIDPGFGTTFQQVFQNLNAASRQLIDEVLPSISAFRGGLVESLTVVTSGGLQVVIVAVLSIYLLYNFPRYNRTLLQAFPQRYRVAALEVNDKVSYAIGGYIRGQLIIAAGVGLLVGIGLAFLQIPLAAGLGVLAGVGNLIPFVGPILASVPTFLFALTESWVHALAALGVLLLVNIIDGNLLTPLIYARIIALDPVTVLLAILFGSVLFGLWGAVAAVPVAVLLTLVYRDYYLTSAWYLEGRTEKGEP